MLKKIVANIYVQGNQDNASFLDVVNLLENSGYEIIWQTYPINACIVKEFPEENGEQ